MTQGMTISEQAKTLAKKVLDQPATEHDIAVVERQLGRYPRGMVAVGARCVCGRPLAVVTRPLLPGGVPFPTTCLFDWPGSGESHLPYRSRRQDEGVQRSFG